MFRQAGSVAGLARRGDSGLPAEHRRPRPPQRRRCGAIHRARQVLPSGADCRQILPGWRRARDGASCSKSLISWLRRSWHGACDPPGSPAMRRARGR